MSLPAFLPFIQPILDVVNRVVPDPQEQARIKADLTQAASDAEARMVEAQASVVRAEAEGNWFQKSWRPIAMFIFLGLLVWYAIPVPIIAQVWGVDITTLIGLDHVPSGLWTLLTVGFGGYVGGRSAEKVIHNLKR